MSIPSRTRRLRSIFKLTHYPISGSGIVHEIPLDAVAKYECDEIDADATTQLRNLARAIQFFSNKKAHASVEFSVAVKP